MRKFAFAGTLVGKSSRWAQLHHRPGCSHHHHYNHRHADPGSASGDDGDGDSADLLLQPGGSKRGSLPKDDIKQGSIVFVFPPSWLGLDLPLLDWLKNITGFLLPKSIVKVILQYINDMPRWLGSVKGLVFHNARNNHREDCVKSLFPWKC